MSIFGFYIFSVAFEDLDLVSGFFKLLDSFGLFWAILNLLKHIHK